MAKTCRSCQSRPIGTGNPGNGMYAEDAANAKALDLCRPCATEGGWENIHSDGHSDSEAEVAACWICHPELNRAGWDPTPRTGTSRAGMTINVPLRASGVEKATHVAGLLPAGYAFSIIKPSKRNGQVTTLKAAKGAGDGIVLKWDANGRFSYGPSTANGKKIRNVAAALRALGA
jgi:hypothetical protein